jgi:hypothetical protein
MLATPLVPAPGEGPRVSTSPGARSLPSVAAPWADRLSLALERRPAGRRWERWVLADLVETRARGALGFRLPIAREEAGPSGQRELLVDETFRSLFGPAPGGSASVAAEALGKTIAAIPFAAAAPFLGIADALAGLVPRGTRTRVATVPLTGSIEISAVTATGGGDRRELRTTGRGSMRLEGRMPSFSGDAAGLSGRPISLDASWRYTKSLVGPWPSGPLVVAVALLALDLALLAVLAWQARHGRRARRAAAARP